MTNKKELNEIINFDNKEYSEEEKFFLYQQFYNILGKTARIKNIPQFIGKCLFEAISHPSKTPKKT